MKKIITTKYFLGKKERIRLRIAFLEKGYEYFKDVARAIGFSTAEISGVLHGARTYTKEFHESLLRVGIDIFKEDVKW